MRTLRIAVSAATLIVSLTALAADSGFAQRVTWQRTDSGLAVAEGLYVFRMSDQRQPSRMLLVTPAGRRFILSHSIATDGIGRHTLLDEGSGWRATFETKWGLPTATLQELYRAHHLENLPKDRSISMAFTITPDRRFAAPQVPYGVAPANVHNEFLQQLQAAGLADQFRNAIPSEIKAELPFLDGALTDEAKGLQFRMLIDVLRHLVGDDTAYPQLTVVTGRSVKGVVLTSGEHVSFASAFRSVMQTDPLVDQ